MPIGTITEEISFQPRLVNHQRHCYCLHLCGQTCCHSVNKNLGINVKLDACILSASQWELTWSADLRHVWPTMF